MARKQPAPVAPSPEREYTDETSYLAWSQAKYYPGTTHAQWDAYFRGSGERPIPRGTAITRPPKATVTRTYAGVLVVETTAGWQATNVISYVEEAA